MGTLSLKFKDFLHSFCAANGLEIVRSEAEGGAGFTTLLPQRETPNTSMMYVNHIPTLMLRFNPLDGDADKLRSSLVVFNGKVIHSDVIDDGAFEDIPFIQEMAKAHLRLCEGVSELSYKPTYGAEEWILKENLGDQVILRSRQCQYHFIKSEENKDENICNECYSIFKADDQKLSNFDAFDDGTRDDIPIDQIKSEPMSQDYDDFISNHTDAYPKREKHEKRKCPMFSTAKDRIELAPDYFYESEGLLFCAPCNLQLNFKKKSICLNHLASAKHKLKVLTGKTYTETIAKTKAKKLEVK